ncbi:hypothetical protein CONLIGDRAFT_694130 [Coniochaeta ligniaria NRRL 30616]|uniref:Uncharacterized protein n=1 Tax=Coniochaeta ligniaria NRRL 30616 TaxID=1408157 RepID=A0A1J7J1Y3_9PEZI|nr:hypothetical protein CONLIGDRAFT_694130 [Coniochaeta ligniaria NRRL 30616]
MPYEAFDAHHPQPSANLPISPWDHDPTHLNEDWQEPLLDFELERDFGLDLPEQPTQSQSQAAGEIETACTIRETDMLLGFRRRISLKALQQKFLDDDAVRYPDRGALLDDWFVQLPNTTFRYGYELKSHFIPPQRFRALSRLALHPDSERSSPTSFAEGLAMTPSSQLQVDALVKITESANRTHQKASESTRKHHNPAFGFASLFK